MKQLFLGLLFILISGFTIQAQDIAKNAIGIRLSDGVSGDEGFGPEFTYQMRVLSDHNRLDLNASWRTNTFINVFRGGGYFHWSYNIWDRLNWFGGPGAGVGYLDFDNVLDLGVVSVDRDSKIFPYVGLDFGVDYRFDFPLQVSFGIRPTYDIHNIDDRPGLQRVDQTNVNVGVAARYTF